MNSWNVNPKSAIEIQNRLRSQISIKPFGVTPRLIAGCDISMNLYSTTVFAGFVVMTFPEMEVVDQSVVKDEVTFPYIPGLLSFREVPSLLKAWEKLKTKPEIVVVDGVGIAHPRRMGIASHLGLVLDIPSVGCAKKVLTGVYEEPAPARGSISYLHDPKNAGEIIGAVIRTKEKVKPVYVSPGHKISIEESIQMILKSSRKHRIPEPTRQAHLLMNEFRRKGSV